MLFWVLEPLIHYFNTGEASVTFSLFDGSRHSTPESVRVNASAYPKSFAFGVLLRVLGLPIAWWLFVSGLGDTIGDFKRWLKRRRDRTD